MLSLSTERISSCESISSLSISSFLFVIKVKVWISIRFSWSSLSLLTRFEYSLEKDLNQLDSRNERYGQLTATSVSSASSSLKGFFFSALTFRSSSSSSAGFEREFKSSSSISSLKFLAATLFCKAILRSFIN